jgi:signal transduction histidine kinase
MACAVGLTAAYLAPFGLHLVWVAPVAALGLWYALLGRRVLTAGDRRTALVFAAGLVVLTFLAAWINPSLAALQCVTLPLVWWVILPHRRNAIILSTLLILAGAAGQWLAFPPGRSLGQQAWVAGALPLIVLAANLIGGRWLDQVIRWGQDRMSRAGQLDAAQARTVVLEREAAAYEERSRIAADIHDTIAQDLAGLAMLGERVRRQALAVRAASTPQDRDRLGDGLVQAADTLTTATRTALAETRALVAATMSVRIGSSLGDALRRVAAGFERETGLAIAVEAADDKLAREAEVVLLRCAQEGLANVRKHAQAGHVVIAVTVADGTATLSVTDDGVGLPEGQVLGRGFGLDGMRERLAMVGGDLRLEPAAGPGSGCRLVATLPADPAHPAAPARGQ